ncbi:tRNA uridine-5-carboxymethylaminomethyl(34) synthesis GTPase MnmE [Fibrobacter sp. HC4]|uniref:tRNA uridine-5-carboxymethylaminomethyl(34) synthesis GTPase MnmE n=1 Tax=Fibrobacter sp. HC4 TaxID=3239812 RepID=UPI00201840B6|nr:tRNA uridine-5-carboxymethylaminomethyl(34) synthesis GTPase MnmE [Fibrobacter succinogenes]MCL4100920.1 tRNA modification GTPase MnmE [Fibrobacter succinogenes]MDO4946581.1 tRNA uridine-5-carboxymethylaminomethyl(34) synthesis GTPase MnmE [Fibrobacter sp.]
MEKQTIVAPMTPNGVSAVAAIRVSGPQVKSVVKTLFGEKAVAGLKSHMAKLGTAKWPASVEGGCRAGAVIDSLLYLYFEGPNSYTGEDVLELYPHGNPLIVRDLLQACRMVEGVRLAEPGEYTRRAFLNGKMDLTQAESVADVIHSANRSELENAHRLLGGALSKKVSALTEQVKDISARMELDVDFAEEEADPDYAGWETRFVAIRQSVQGILDSFRGKAEVGRLPLVVLYGAPNAGKSSLVNALLGEDRILVSDIAGTTRDFVEVRLFLDGGEIRLVDTAGLAEKAADALDALSMEKSRQILAEADMKILLVDSSVDGVVGSSSDVILSEAKNLDLQSNPDLVLRTKQDLNQVPVKDGELAISSKTGAGLAELKSALNARLFKNRENSEDLWITSEREKACLEEALAGIDRVLLQLRSNPAVELLAFEMQIVRRALQSITGEISSEDVLQSIFAGFCIGK